MASQQQRLAIYDDETDALRELVRELGGFKPVGASLRPDLAPDRASNWLRDCLNVERPERLQPSQLFMLFKMGRERGIHGPCEYILGEIGYAVQPIAPHDEAAELQRQFIEAVRLQRIISEKLERVAPGLRSAA